MKLIFSSLSLFDQPPWPHSALIVGRWCSNPIKNSTWILISVPIWYLKCYIVLLCYFPPTPLPPLWPPRLVPPPELPRPAPPPGPTPPIPTTFFRPATLTSAPPPHRVSELVVSQCTEWPCSASSVFMDLPPPSPPPTLYSPRGVLPSAVRTPP